LVVAATHIAEAMRFGRFPLRQFSQSRQPPNLG
jgi:hypothetical protein